MKFFIVLILLYIPFKIILPQTFAEKELLSQIKVDYENSIWYQSNMDGLFSPAGPILNEMGQILFFPTTGKYQYINLIKIINDGNTEISPIYPIMKTWKGSSKIEFISQMGYIQSSNLFIKANYQNLDLSFYPQKTNNKIGTIYKPIYYFLPNGSLLESIDNSKLFSTEYIGPDNQVVRNLQETRTWLPGQPGGFSIGEDGRLYKNGMPWSVVQPDDGSPAGMYLGKLMSGHNLWADGPGSRMDSVRYFTISNPQGKAEIIMEVPWGNKNMMDPVSYFRLYNYGIGPWGEIYCLIAPPWKEGANYYQPEPGIPAELVVIRNHLKFFGRLNEQDVRLRREPNTKSPIIGTYPAKTGFRILETGTKPETIGGQKNVWYRVRLLDGTEGWFFGAFVHNLYDGPNGLPPPWPNVADW